MGASASGAGASMNNAALYILTVFIWGSTWIGIKYQLGEVSPLVSIGHRFPQATAPDEEGEDHQGGQ